MDKISKIGNSDNSQTSVDWLVEQLPQIDWDDPYYVGLYQEAKGIEDFKSNADYNKGYEDGYKDGRR